MRNITFLSAALLLATPAFAQVSGAGVLTSDMTAAATCGTTKQNDSEKKDTKFSRGIGVSAYNRGCSAAHGSASIHSSTNWWKRQNVTSANASASTWVYGKDASSKGSGNVGGQNGNGVQFTLSADADVKGKLTIRIGGFASDKQSASGSVKFGTTTLSWKQGDKPVVHEADVTIGKTGMVFDTTTAADSALDGKGRASAGVNVSITFVSGMSNGSCKVEKGVDGCGPELTGTVSSSFFGHTLTLNLKKAAQNGIGLRAWSKDGKTFDLNKCPIFTDIGILTAFMVDGNGEAKQLVRLPRGAYTMHVENVILSLSKTGVSVASSNTLKVTCTK